MLVLNRRAVLAGVVAVSATRLTPSVLAQQEAPQAFGYNDVVKRAHDLAAAPFDATVPPLPGRRSPISISTPGATSASRATSRCSAPQTAISVSSCSISAISTRGRWRSTCCATAFPRRSPTRPTYSITAATKSPAHTDQSRLRRLPPALSAQCAPCDGRGDRLSRRELLPFSRPRPALRAFGAGTGRSGSGAKPTRNFRSSANSGSRRRIRTPSA